MSPAFQPTHAAPEGGLPAWQQPIAGMPVVATIDPRVEMQVIGVQGDWAHILCSNGWSAWVDGRRLDPLTAPAAVAAPSTPSPQLAPAVPAGPRPPSPTPTDSIGRRGRDRTRILVGVGVGVGVVVVAAVAATLLLGNHSGSGPSALRPACTALTTIEVSGATHAEVSEGTRAELTAPGVRPVDWCFWSTNSASSPDILLDVYKELPPLPPGVQREPAPYPHLPHAFHLTYSGGQSVEVAVGQFTVSVASSPEVSKYELLHLLDLAVGRLKG